MNTSAQPLIHLQGVTKVFYTDEVETHALAGIHLEIKSGELKTMTRPIGYRNGARRRPDRYRCAGVRPTCRAASLAERTRGPFRYFG